MSDNIVRTTVEENDANIIKSQVMNVLDDNLIRHQVRGLDQPSPEPPVLETLNVTENGTYTPEEGVDGFNPVIVEVPEPTPANNIISQIKVVDVEGTPTIKDIKRNLNITGNAIGILNGNINFTSDNNALMRCNNSQIDHVAYMFEMDIVSFNSDGDSHKKGLFTFGTSQSTMYGLFFDEQGQGFGLKFRGSNATYTIATNDELTPSMLNGKTLKLYINCKIVNNEIIYNDNSIIVMIDDVVINQFDNTSCNLLNNNSYANVGWSSYSWGAVNLVISEYRMKVLSSLM